MSKKRNIFFYIRKSKFIRSIFIQAVTIFTVLLLLIVLIVFLSFSKRINNTVITNKENQLESITSYVSTRIEELSSIAYNIGNDESFYFEPNGETTDEQMTRMLRRYLVGNDFVEFLMYYRLSEEDKVYTSSGNYTFVNFLDTYFTIDTSYDEYFREIKSCTNTLVLNTNAEDEVYITYIYALPHPSNNPKAFVIMYIPSSKLEAFLRPHLINYFGQISIFDANNKEIFTLSDFNEVFNCDISSLKENQELIINKDKYIFQKKKSTFNNWSYVSIIRLNDITSDIVKTQIIFAIILFILLVISILIMLTGIMKRYVPIRDLAVSLSSADEDSKILDEKNLLTSSITTLKDDSRQKQKFENAYLEAEAASKAKSAFLSNMSHDIRTPMNAIVGMTEIAFKHLDDSDYIRECLKKIQVSSNYLLDIINNILDMSRIESGKFSLTEEIVEIPKVIYSIYTIVNQSVQTKHQHLSIEIDNLFNENVIGDTLRITQIFINILSNSIKFTPEDGYISLHVKQEAEIDGFSNFVFTFSDTGIGMKKEFISKIFDSFSRADETNISQTEGTGLGMAITKNLIEMMKGSIECISELNKGTTFIVKIPFKLINDENINRINKNINMYNKLSVLIIGDDEIIVNKQISLFKQVIKEVDYSLSAEKTNHLIKKSIDNPYKIILINQVNNDTSGINIAKTILSSYKQKKVKLILASKDFTNIDQSAALNAGISSFVKIPLFMSTILDILDDFIQNKNKFGKEKTTITKLKGLKILLAEDNSLNREIAREIILSFDAKIQEAKNGLEAYNIYNEAPDNYFDIILMDLQMPIMNGYEATKKIRLSNKPDCDVIPIFALTANTFDEDVRQVREAGMNGHIGKPYTTLDLYNVLNLVYKNKTSKKE